MIVVAGLDLFERHAAVDRLAHQAIVVRHGAGEIVAERLLDDRISSGRIEHALLEAVDDHLRLRPVAEPLADRADQAAGVLAGSARSSR